MKRLGKSMLFSLGGLLCLSLLGWGGWMRLRDKLVQTRVQAALQTLRDHGLGTRMGELTWSSWRMGKLDRLSIIGNAEQQLLLEGIAFELQPRFSRPGRSWVQALSCAKITGNWGGWQVLANGSMNPRSKAGKITGHIGWGAGDTLQPWLAAEFMLQVGNHTACLAGSRYPLALEIEGLQMAHPALGQGARTIRKLAVWAQVEQSAQGCALRPGSCLRVQDLRLDLQMRWQAPTQHLDAQVALPPQPAQHLLDLAQALAPDDLQGLALGGQARGEWALALDLDSLPSLRLGGGLSAEALQLTEAGLSGLDRLPDLARQLSPCKLSSLPAYLPAAVCLAEDANFWQHQGFDAEIIRLAILENWEARRFVRGAGTIPMQLIRNLFLHQGKQLDRKVAEVALTWIMEQTHMLSKPAALELYLNLIEWGPNVYGINAASTYYFHKSPPHLTLDECIFLSAIIPNPRYFAQLLDSDGSLNAYTQDYFDSMRWMLYENEVIGEECLAADYPKFPTLLHLQERRM